MKTIKKDQEFKCIKDYVICTGGIAYKVGKIYKSENDGWLINEQEEPHKMTLNDEFYEYFELVEPRVKITWLDEINPKPMKTEIEIPAGCKIAKTEIIDGKLIVTYEFDLPDNVSDIPNRDWFIDNKGDVFEAKGFSDINNFSTKERAEAILALGQLLELAAYVGGIELDLNFTFDNQDLLDAFNKKYTDLFEKAKKIL